MSTAAINVQQCRDRAGAHADIHAELSLAGSDLTRPTNPRYLSLDVWRGVACLMVVVAHSSTYLYSGVDAVASNPVGLSNRIIGILGSSELGVIAFFVISGYCIAATCDSTRRRPDGLRQYFYRRIRRIFPPYWVALIATGLFVAIVAKVFGAALLTDAWHPIPSPTTLGAFQWLGNVFLIEGWRSRVFGGTYLFQLGPAWTLCYEEQFYALCGLVLLFAPRRFFSGIVAISLLTLGIILTKRSIPGLFFDGNWLVFAAGVLVYFQVNYATRVHQCILTVGLVAVAAACVAKYSLSAWQSPIFFLGPAVALAFLALHPFDRWIASSRILRPLKFCGVICYSLYLVHWPIVKFISHSLWLMGMRSASGTLLVTIPLCGAASLLVAWGFHVVVERRFLNRKLPAKVS